MFEVEGPHARRDRIAQRANDALNSTPAMIEARRIQRLNAALDTLEGRTARENATGVAFDADSASNDAQDAEAVLQAANGALRSDANATGDSLTTATDFSQMIREGLEQGLRRRRD